MKHEFVMMIDMDSINETVNNAINEKLRASFVKRIAAGEPASEVYVSMRLGKTVL